MPLPQGPAIITGGSSGIGLATALRLAERGHPIALLARRDAPLHEAARWIGAQSPGLPIHVEIADVTDAAGLQAAIRRCVDALGPPGIVVCSAGITAPGLFADLTPETHLDVMNVNYFGCVNTLRATLPHLLPKARIGLISSAAGLSGLYGYSAYAPSKFALRGLAEVLRVELAPQGIGVTLCMPPDTDTPQLAAEIPLRPAVTNRIAALGGILSADQVATALIRGMAANRFLVLPDRSIKALHLFGGLSGPPMRWLQGWFLRRS
ncbi:MAG: short-chain dehydrogenase [Rhodobacter sp.]|nr:short-chain dehydrogenase [Rhodobacter sp.]